jgi:hypothetical protein
MKTPGTHKSKSIQIIEEKLIDNNNNTDLTFEPNVPA